jgi:hypothetical protein
MKTRYRLTCRGCRGGKFYCVDTLSGKRVSLLPRTDSTLSYAAFDNTFLRYLEQPHCKLPKSFSEGGEISLNHRLVGMKTH